VFFVSLWFSLLVVYNIFMSNYGRFVSTQWSLVLAAGKHSTPEAEQALATLCANYWKPLYSYIRRRGYTAPEAQDLTQSFFQHLLEKNSFQYAERERGKFRSFLLASLNHFLSNEWDREQAQKRGGHLQIVSLEEIASLEDRYSPESVPTPEKLFERQWALLLLDRVLMRLAGEFEAAGKKGLFEHLKAFLTMSDGRVPYNKAAAELGMTEGALRVSVHRLRRRFGELLRAEVAETIADPSESSQIDEEIGYLLAALGS
jgi:DNA-directed RNA polymerase specialized sigma24 family protein